MLVVTPTLLHFVRALSLNQIVVYDTSNIKTYTDKSREANPVPTSTLADDIATMHDIVLLSMGVRTINMPISTEISGMPTMRPKTGSPV